jgi:GNAT superfamily N-acetyltransferase
MSFKHIRQKVQSEGFAGLLLAAFIRIPGVTAACAYTNYTRPVPGVDAPPDPIRPHTLQLISTFAAGGTALSQVQDKEDLFAARFRRGDVCVVATVGGEGVGYVWAQHGGVHREERFGFPVPVGPHQIYYYDLFVRNEYRRGGLFRALLHRLEVHARDVGATELCAIVEWQNKRSIQVHRRFGMLPRSTHIFVCLNGRTIHWQLSGW